MKKVLLCGFFILLSSTLAHGITCYRCKELLKDSCRGETVKCRPNIDRCETESVYSPGGKFLGVYADCPTALDYNRCGTILRFATEIQVQDCCDTDKCNGKRAPFPPPDCAKPALGA